MNRSLNTLILVLAVSLGVLWGLDRYQDSRVHQRRVRDSTHRLLGGTAIPLEQVTRMELSLPGSDSSWSFRRVDIGWRLPQYRDAYAETARVNAILGAVVEGRGTLVGHWPGDSAYYGVTERDSMKVALFDRQDALVTTVWVGLVAPGNRSRESYMLVEGNGLIYHVDSNPWPPVKWTPGNAYPPLLDRRVIPGALNRRSVVSISFADRGLPELQKILRKKLEPGPQAMMRPGTGPRYEWYGTLRDGTRKRLQDTPARSHVNRVLNLTFAELLGSRMALTDELQDPLVSMTLAYDGDMEDVLELRATGNPGKYTVYNVTTDQVFVVDKQTAAAFTPDLNVLLQGGHRAGLPTGP